MKSIFKNDCVLRIVVKFYATSTALHVHSIKKQ